MRYSRFFALVVALLFVAHPVQTEAVTYVFQRFASLVTLFYLLSLVFYIRGRLGATGNGQWEEGEDKTGGRRQGTTGREQDEVPRPIAHRLLPIAYYSFSLLFAVLAMKTKENAFTLPMIITLYEFLFFRGPLKSRVLRLAPFLLTLLIIPISVLRIEGSFGEVVKPMAEPTALGYENLSPQTYLFTQFRVIVTYLRLLFLPFGQNLVYHYPTYDAFFRLPVLASFAFLSALFGAAVWLLYRSRQMATGYGQEVHTERQRTRTERSAELTAQRRAESTPYAVSNKQDGESMQSGKPAGKDEAQDSSPIASRLLPIACLRLVAFGILWFFITLSVESSVIPLAMVIDEYRLYLPSVGFFLAATAGSFLLLERFTRTHGRILSAAVLSVVVLLTAAAYARNSLWENKISLWQDVVKKNPDSAKAYNNLGIAYYEKGLYEKAIAAYRHAISLSPGNFFAYTNLGAAYASAGRLDMAVGEFMKAIETEPKNGVAYANLARVYRRLGQFGKAVGNYRAAVALDPFNESAFYGLGTTYMTLGRTDEAIAAFSEFIVLRPQNPEAYRNRGLAYARKGDIPSAQADFSKSCALGNRESCGYLKAERQP